MKKRHLVPLLLTSHGYGYQKQTVYSLIENRYKTICHPDLDGKRILGSDYGWLVLTDCNTFTDADNCCLWNPETKEKIQLPRLDQAWLYSRCVLSKPPTDPDCLVVLKSYINYFDQSVCRINDNEFVKVSAKEETYAFRLLVAITSFQGQIYGFVKSQTNYELVTINMVGKDVVFEPLLINGESYLKVPELSQRWVKWHQSYLIESPGGAGELFFVIKMMAGHHSSNYVEFKVFRLDVNELVCVEVENLDGYTIFIGSWGDGFCCASDGMRIKSNSIYYSDTYTRIVCVYDLDDRSKTRLLPCSVAHRYRW